MILLSNHSYSIGPGDIALIEVAMNTLNSVRELNQIVTEQREFNDNFERVYQKVDQGIWKADRTALWLEDIKSLKETKVENIKDFNSVLRRIKDETEFVRRKLVIQYNLRQETQQTLEGSNNDRKKDRKRIAQYSSEANSKLSPDAAQLETARNTKDILIENARLNSKIGTMNREISKLSLTVQTQEQRFLAKKLKNIKSLRQEKRGILTQKDVKR
jgi:acetyl/propionyl-CoA carboxylase alpha subunit